MRRGPYSDALDAAVTRAELLEREIAALRAKLARKSLFTRIAPRTRLEWFIYALGALVIAVCIAALRYIFVAG